MGNILDTKKNVFLAPSCLKDLKTVDRVLKILEGYKMSKNKIFKGIDMNILNSDDYLIRCSEGVLQLWEAQLTVPFGFTTKLLGNLG